jgi:hypothetical protein
VILPRNGYTRAAARMAGKLRARATRCGGVRLSGADGKRGEWLIDDPDGYVDRIFDLEAEAYRWRSAWWCSENVGGQLHAGGLTLKALAMQALWLTAIPSAIAAIGAGVLAVMWMGAAVLR